MALLACGANESYDAYLAALERHVTERYAEQGTLDALMATEYSRTILTVAMLGGDPTAFGTRPDGTTVDLLDDGVWNFAGELGAQGLNGLIFALLEAMEERRVTVDGKTHPLPQPFFVLATQNPVGSAGTQLLPPAQLDRFLLCLSMGYPDRESQVELMKERHHADPLAQVRPVTDAAALGGLMDAAAMTFVADPVYDYTARLLEATRCHESLQLGLSPRAGLALCRAAKARAFLHARDYVLPEDVAEAAPDVCAHRLVLAPRARLHDETARSVLAEILERVPQPAVREFKS